MTHAMTRAASLITLPMSVLLLAGCSMSSGTAGTADPNAGADPNTSASASAAPASSAASSEAKIGQTVTYDDGLAITLTDKGTFKPSEFADKKKAKAYRKYQITVKNGTSEPVDPTLIYPTMQDGEEEAYAVTDVEAKIGLAPQTKVRAGKTVKWLVAFGTNTDDLTIEVPTGDYQHDDATFVSE